MNSTTSPAAYSKGRANPHAASRSRIALQRVRRPQVKALWVTAFPTQARKKKVKSRPVKKDRGDLKAYRAARLIYLRAHSVCACYGVVFSPIETLCSLSATDIHHIRGRRGRLLLDQRFWMPVCRHAHDWIGSHPAEARTLGWLCQVGEWNTPKAP